MTVTHSFSPEALTIATRESRLAVAQTQMIGAQLQNLLNCGIALLKLTTQGDIILDRALSEIGGKGIFVKELEKALQTGQAQLAVHSLKDVPMSLPDGFLLAAVPKREDPRDAFISNKYERFEDLPADAVVGTSSLRRQVLLRDLRPDLRIEMLRGNLDTRLRKLDEGQFDAIILAVAGLKRLQLQDRIKSAFDVSQMIPSAGQGALGIEIHSSRPDLLEAIGRLTDPATLIACSAERAVSRALGGNCSVPLAAHATIDADNQLELCVAWGDIQGEKPLIRVKRQCRVDFNDLPQTLALVEGLGRDAASDLIAQGAQISAPNTP